jgi:hypothetical protein
MFNLKLNSKTMKSYIYGAAAVLALASCKKDDDTPNNPPPVEGEVITTVNLHFLNAADSSVNTFTFRDPDGPGGAEPVQFDTIALMSASNYYLAIELLNEAEVPAEDITAEVEEEGVDHQFFFTSSTPQVSVAYADADDNGNPIGLLNTVTVGTPVSLQTLRVVLRHQPGVKAPAPGDPTKGDTDIDLLFQLNVL